MLPLVTEWIPDSFSIKQANNLTFLIRLLLKIKYAKDRVKILYTDGTVKEIPKDKTAIAEELLSADKEVVTIHSVEPDLKTIFLDLTGRELA